MILESRPPRGYSPRSFFGALWVVEVIFQVLDIIAILLARQVL